jgi:hypothetical protein
MSPFLASYIASILAIILCIALLFHRSKQIVDFFKPQIAESSVFTRKKLKVWGSIFLIIINLMFALVAAVVYSYFENWFGQAAQINFVVGAFSFAFLFSILAVLTRKEGMVFEKICLNLIFALVYGILIPVLV